MTAIVQFGLLVEYDDNCNVGLQFSIFVWDTLEDRPKEASRRGKGSGLHALMKLKSLFTKIKLATFNE